jgi:predicted DCC family thiol-disulfide oxidoreductase YuxK
MLYDGLCPFCTREAAALRRRDRNGFIDFEDISDSGFDPTQYGLTMKQVMGAMHAIKPDGSILRGLDAFVEAYRLCGLGWLSKVIAFRPTRPILEIAYRLFARVRPRFSRNAACSDRCAPRKS